MENGTLPSMDADVIVVGAGLAGLRCAKLLAESGHETLLVEAADHVGGRQRTDDVDGYTLDRGFQVINPAYPALHRAVDVADLGLRSFGAGLQVRTDAGLRVVADPRRNPGQLRGTLRSGFLHPRELSSLGRWLLPTLLRPATTKVGPDATLAESWDACGLSGPLRRQVLEPFLAGVLLDDSGTSSAQFARLLTRMFALGTPGLPAGGVQQLPLAMARGLRVRLRAPVVSVTPGSEPVVHLSDGARLVGRALVLAVSPEQLPRLVPGRKTPDMRGVLTWWFSADERPSHSTMLLVDGRGAQAGPIVNTAVMSTPLPTYAPPRRHLIQATCLLHPATEPADEAAVRTQLRALWGTDTSRWEVVARHEIPHALPAQPAPLSLTRPNTVAPGIVAAGDHLDTASIQGALVSGERAASAVRSLFRSQRRLPPE